MKTPRVNTSRWITIDRSEYERMKSASLRVRKIVMRPGPKGTRFEANMLDVRKWYRQLLQ